jgi:hypothetical protein
MVFWPIIERGFLGFQGVFVFFYVFLTLLAQMAKSQKVAKMELKCCKHEGAHGGAGIAGTNV